MDKHKERRNAYCRRWYQLNKERHRQYHKKDREANPEKYRVSQKRYYEENKKELLEAGREYWQSPKGRLVNYKAGAKDRGIPFELTFEEFMSFWQKPCWYCSSNIKTIGLDRVDNTLSYKLKNVVPCCERCNKGKLELSQEEFILACHRVAKNHPRVV